jgi:hypothetical protein
VMADVGSVGGHPRLEEVLSAHPAPIDDIDEVVLGARCEERARASTGWDGAPFHDLAMDVAVERDGPTRWRGWLVTRPCRGGKGSGNAG